MSGESEGCCWGFGECSLVSRFFCCGHSFINEGVRRLLSSRAWLNKRGNCRGLDLRTAKSSKTSSYLRCCELGQGRRFCRWCRGFLWDDDFIGGRRRGHLTKSNAVVPGRYHFVDLERGFFWMLLTESGDKVLTKRLTLRGGSSGDGEAWRSHCSAEESLSIHKITPGHIST